MHARSICGRSRIVSRFIQVKPLRIPRCLIILEFDYISAIEIYVFYPLGSLLPAEILFG